MQSEVYADLLFLINFSMDFLSFYITSALMHRKLRPFRSVASSSVGGAYAVAALFFPTHWFIALLVDIVVCVLMNIITFYGKKCGIGSVFLCSLVYFGVSAVLGGCMTALYSLFNQSGIPLGEVKEDGIDTWAFIILAMVSGILTFIAGRFFRKSSDIKRCTVSVCILGKTAELEGMNDSGNLLTDPISGRPVVVADINTLSGLLPGEFTEAVKQGSAFADTRVYGALAPRIRLIPAKTATGPGIMAAIIPDSLRIIPEGKAPRETDALIAPAVLDGSAGGLYALVPSGLMI